jgi:glucose-1-phosphate cytidylyltransferase
MKVIILAGGFGTRISEYTNLIPKPMIPIGDKPILWHVMKRYADFGFKDFVLALGYKADVIKNYFGNYHISNNDFKVNLSDGHIDYLGKADIDWSVTLVDTGLNTMTGGRIKRLRDYIGKESFMLTYGDGVADVDIKNLIESHKKRKKLVTLTAVRPSARFGELVIDKEDNIQAFEEKPQIHSGWINGGFFVCEPEVFDHIEDDSIMFEREPLEQLVKDGQLNAYKHNGFWQCMDSKKDNDLLNKLWDEGNPPWEKI